jgi:vacuolar-type H+-ATPase subunit H
MPRRTRSRHARQKAKLELRTTEKQFRALTRELHNEQQERAAAGCAPIVENVENGNTPALRVVDEID